MLAKLNGYTNFLSIWAFTFDTVLNWRVSTFIKQARITASITKDWGRNLSFYLCYIHTERTSKSIRKWCTKNGSIIRLGKVAAINLIESV